MRLISLADLKTFLEKTDASHDELMGLIIERVSISIEKYLNRNLLKTERTIKRDAGKRYYYLPAYPIDENAQLIVSYCNVVKTQNLEYFVRAEDGLIEFQTGAIFSYMNPQEMSFTWTGGYANIGEDEFECLDVPIDFQDAVSRQCAYNFRRRKDIGISSVSMPDGSVNKNPVDSFLLPEVKRLLQNFRRPAGLY